MRILIILAFVAYVQAQEQNLCGTRTDTALKFVDDPSACDAYLWCNFDQQQVLQSVHQVRCPTGFNFDTAAGGCSAQFTCTAQCEHNTETINSAVPDDTTCRTFVTCTSATVGTVVGNCTEPSVFNRNFGICTTASIAPCGSGGGGGGGVESCGPNDNKQINDPSACNRFFQCTSGTLSASRTCPNNLHFNPDGNFCDQPENLNPRCVDPTTHIDIPTAPLIDVGYARFRMMLNRK